MKKPPLIHSSRARRLLGKARHIVLVQLQPAERRRRIDAQHRAEAVVRQMEGQLLAEVGVGEPVAIGDGEMLGIAQMAFGGAGDPRTGHRRSTGMRHGHFPIGRQAGLVVADGTAAQVDGEIGVLAGEVEEVGCRSRRRGSRRRERSGESPTGRSSP